MAAISNFQNGRQKGIFYSQFAHSKHRFFSRLCKHMFSGTLNRLEMHMEQLRLLYLDLSAISKFKMAAT